MIITNTIIFFILGSIVGSFINVLVLRYNTGLSFVFGNSKCFSCGHKLSAFDLIPIFSFIFLHGKCRYCQSKISLQYPLVELITAIIFSLVYLLFNIWGIFYLIFILIISFLLISITVYDYKHKIIPDGLVYTFIILTLLHRLYFIGFENIFSFPFYLDLLAGPILFLFFAFFWLISSGRWMGFGDAKLALGVGWLLGFVYGISAIILAFYIGAIFGLLAILLQRLKKSSGKLTIKSELPFAPFIILAVFVELFTKVDMTQIGVILNIIK